jgi:hypothetical protein
VIWIIVAVPAQLEQYRFFRHRNLVNRRQFEQALAYLARYQKADLPAGRRLEPNPYEYRVWQDLPPMIALLTTNTPLWMRDVYLSHAAVMLTHYHGQYHFLTNVARMFSAIEQLPEGRRWLFTNQVALGRQSLPGRHSRQEDISSHTNVLTNIVITLRRMGMSETNLTRMVE